MALFFDQKWFNEKLKAAGLSKPEMANALGLGNKELEAMWKDQREISDREIGTMAMLLSVSEGDVRKHGGVQGSPEARAARTRKSEPAQAVPVDDLEARLARVEARLAKLEAQLLNET